jgi:phosphopantothenoylcysteine synthetase/decarboxylase
MIPMTSAVVPPYPFMSNFVITESNLVTQEQKESLKRILERAFNRDGIRANTVSGANSQMFSREIQSVIDSEDFQQTNDPKERKELLAEVLLDWVICIANE